MEGLSVIALLGDQKSLSVSNNIQVLKWEEREHLSKGASDEQEIPDKAY